MVRFLGESIAHQSTYGFTWPLISAFWQQTSQTASEFKNDCWRILIREVDLTIMYLLDKSNFESKQLQYFK